MNKLLPWTVFIDMLGYRNINGEINDEEKANDFIKFMTSNEEVFSHQDNEDIKRTYKKGAFDLYEFYEIKTLFVSDSLVITYTPKVQKDEISELHYYMHSANTLIILIKRLQTFIYKCLKEKEIFIRGGISNKFAKIEKNFAVGEGLIEAYEIESKISIYPRICLATSISDNTKLILAFNKICQLIYNIDSFLKEENGVFFIDYLKHNLTEPEHSLLQKIVKHSFFKVHQECIVKKLTEICIQIEEEQDSNKKENLVKIKKKYNWIKNYHNETLQNYDKQYIIE